MYIKYKNNPLNIRYEGRSQWLGLSGCDRGFCTFDDVKFGIRAAAFLLMKSYRKAGCYTLSQIIHRYAPISENNTQAYIDYLCMCLHVKPDYVPQTVRNFSGLIHFMWKFEQGTKDVYPADWILRIICEFNLRPYERSKAKPVKK